LLCENPGDGALVSLEEEPNYDKHEIPASHSDEVGLSYLELIAFVVKVLEVLRHFHGSGGNLDIQHEPLSDSLVAESEHFLVLFN